MIIRNWDLLKKCLKPILKEIKEERSKEKEQTVYLDGIERIVNTLKMNWETSSDTKEKKSNPTGISTVSNKPKLLTKPAKVPMWTKDLTLETYIKQVQSWTDVLEDIPEHVKFADLIESLKTNKEIKGLQKYVGEHILPVLETKVDQTLKKVLEILILKYGRTRVEQIEDFMKDWSKFKDDQYKDDRELLLGMRELNQRRKELNMTEDEWVSVWMLGIVKKRKRLDKFVYQSLRDIVKVRGDNIVKNFEEKFKELRVEGNRKEVNSSSVMFREEDEHFDAEEIKEDDLDEEDQS